MRHERNTMMARQGRQGLRWHSDKRIRPDIFCCGLSSATGALAWRRVEIPKNTSEELENEPKDLRAIELSTGPRFRLLQDNASGRCGKKISFPCSCSAACVIYGTCCDNMAQDCPHVWEERRSSFNLIRTLDYFATKTRSTQSIPVLLLN
ncbi:hypothetical protein PoB_002030100 [Plakobranchus ocellatus]|uniref:SMB domain-containing protein n=1 Tax=Plakobranchus ocellatus TaxID=259542 RepID=A0AAV3ZD16_9GAST|nr:hypothetical protein PoB_002030100 [Plakobranchus ocellatus]